MKEHSVSCLRFHCLLQAISQLLIGASPNGKKLVHPDSMALSPQFRVSELSSDPPRILQLEVRITHV